MYIQYIYAYHFYIHLHFTIGTKIRTYLKHTMHICIAYNLQFIYHRRFKSL